MMVPAELLRALPRGARFLPAADGFRLIWPDGGAVEVRERLRPLRALEDAEPAVTREGEAAALDEAGGVGVVYADDWCRLIVGTGVAPEVVRRVTLELPLGLAHLRRRAYHYRPPAGWAGRRRHRLIAEWLAPGYPAEPTLLTVFPARPLRESSAGLLDRRLHEMGGLAADSVEGPFAIDCAPALAGGRYRLAGPNGGVVDAVALSDGLFQYLVRLDHDGSAGAVLTALVRTIVPIPPRLVAAPVGTFAHMVD